MAFSGQLKGIFGSGPQRVAPPRVSTDEVLPVHFFDDSATNRTLIISWTLRFNEVLDADKLNNSLQKLLSIGGWRRLGGRLRETKDGKLEIHIPQEFTPERPAVGYSHETFGISIDEHPLASRLPQASDRPYVHDFGDEFMNLAVRQDTPRVFEDYTCTDNPQLALHVISFMDATLVSLAWPHITTDAMGLHALVTNWCKVLAGREGEVTPLGGLQNDPLETVGTGSVPEQEERWMYKDQAIAGISMLIWVLRFVWEIIWVRKQEPRIIFLPAASVKGLRERAINELAAEAKNADEKPFLSEGDVLTAWATRMACLHLSPSSKQGVSVMNVFEVRSRLPSIFKAGAVYIGNFVFPSWTLFTAGELLTQPLGKLALKLRTNLAAQITEGQVRGMLRTMRETMASAGRPALVLQPRSIMMTFSSWTKAKFFDVVDFSPAIIKGGKPGLVVPKPGHPVYYHSAPVTPPPTMRNVYNISGKDAAGNYWITGVLLPQIWPKIEEELKRMQ